MEKIKILYYFLYVFSFIVGITVGVVIALSSISKKIMSRISVNTDQAYEKIEEDKKEHIASIINETTNYYEQLQAIRSKNSRLIFRKKKTPAVKEVKDLKYLVTEIAKVFYPNSQEPLLELSVNEVFEVAQRVTMRLDQTFDATKLTFFRYLKLSSFYMAFGLYNKISAIKNRNLIQFAMRAINFSVLLTTVINPFALFRAQTKRKANKSFTSVLISNICNIIGKEVACVYSKNLSLNDEDELVELVETN